jgi:hypothetical protein
MADDLVNIPDSLKQRFSEFAQVASLTQSLQQNIDLINQDNVDAGGKDDKTARAYHSQVDGPTKDLSTVVGDIAKAFGLTSENGAAAADVLNQGTDAANDQANSL